MQLTMLPAAEGDALWLEWGPDDDRRQLLVDMGVHATGKAIRQRLEDLPKDRRVFELLVVTHVDTDHIYGVLSGLVEKAPPEGTRIKDVWFNGYTHLGGGQVEPLTSPEDKDAVAADAKKHVFGDNADPKLESYGGRQGEQFSIWLRKHPWNLAFGGGAVTRIPGEPLPTRELAHGLRLTVLGPTPARLQALAPKWKKEVADAIRKGKLDADEIAPGLAPTPPPPPGLEPMGKTRPKRPALDTSEDLLALAHTDFNSDDAKPNGSSIALLVECDGKRLLLAGDAFPQDLVEVLPLLGDPIPKLDAFKLPHHGSKNNVSTDLIKAVDCSNWLFSTNGVKHYHPDAAAVARVLQHSTKPPTLHFNEPSPYNQWWKDPTWQSTFAYRAHYGDPQTGYTLTI